jgi:putative DNA primase/helicase
MILPPPLAPIAAQPRWVLWKWVKGKNGKRTKPPFQGRAPHKFASSTDPSTWCSLDTAMKAYCDGKADGIGFVISGSNYGALDLDDCRDPETGAIHPWALDLIKRSGSYAEITPSNEGARIFGLAAGEPLHRKFSVPVADGMSCELYRRAERYITITGSQIGTATALVNIDAQIDALLAELDGAKQNAKQTKPEARNESIKASHKHDLDSLIREGCGDDFGGDRSRAVWFVINTLLKQGCSADDVINVLLDRGNGISAHVYDQPRPADYARKQVEKAQKEQSEDPVAAIERLAKLTAIEYEQQRKNAAEKLNVRASILDRLVEGERARLNPNADDGRQGHAVSFPEPQPWPDPVDGAALLDEIATTIRRHVVMPEHARDTCALWAVHCFLTDRFFVSPRLGIRSPTKGCGKTLLLDVLGRLVARPLPTANVTPAAIFRVVEAHRPTLLIDEADTFLYDNDELRGVLNGNRKGSTVLRTVGDDHEPRAFATYSACAIALIGALPDTLHDRSVTIDLQRRRPNEEIEPLRPDRADYLDVLARKAARWAQDHGDRVGESDPEMPPGIINRAADNWRPLLAIADVARGEWPERARKAAEMSHNAEGHEASQLELLLGDIRGIRDEKNVDQIPSGDLVQALVDLVGHPWAEMGKSRKPLTQNRLARMLAVPGVRIAPKQIRVSHKGGIAGQEIEKQVRGYVFADFEDAFARYLLPKGGSKCHSHKCSTHGDF